MKRCSWREFNRTWATPAAGRFAFGVVLLGISGIGCTEGELNTAERGDAAVWHIAPGQAMKNDSFIANVTRVGCNGGTTGEVLAPTIDLRRDEIVVTFFVSAIPEGFYTCPGNNAVPYVVSVGEAIGGRPLVDGSCLAGQVTQTTYCTIGATRWNP